MQDLPQDIVLWIAQYTAVRDAVNLGRVSSQFSLLLSDSVPSLIYLIASRYSIPAWEQHRENLYTTYYRGKIYATSQERSKQVDIPFELSEHERALACREVKMSDSDSNGLLLLTARCDDRYGFYIFRPEVRSTDEHTPDYYGWDPDEDLNTFVLMDRAIICDISSAKEHIDNRHEYGAGRAIRSCLRDQAEYITEDVEDCMSELVRAAVTGLSASK